MTISPIILCGGEGSRLWPVSRRDFPKQFAQLVGELSCFQQAALRLAGAGGASSPVIVAGETHESIIRDQLEAIGLNAAIILEPEGRDSAPATAAAAAYLLNEGRDGAAIMQPADHHIPDPERFCAAAELAACAAENGYIVTFGIEPTAPDTSYGYINPAEPLVECPGAAKVRRFVEKPSRELAVEYLAQGFLWNSGMFAFRPSVLLEEMHAFEPAIADAIERAVAAARHNGNVIRLDPASFGQSPKKSLDYAVMERTEKAAVVTGKFPWSDLGAWSAIHATYPKDANGNAIAGGEVVVLESDRCFVRSSSMPVAVVGLSDVGVIVEGDGVLVCKLDASPTVKAVVETFRSRGCPEALRRTQATDRRRSFADLPSAADSLSRWLNNSALPLWWTAGADHERCGFYELLDQDGHPVEGPRRLRVQARQVYVFATAGEAGWNGPWRAAIRHGLEALQRDYRRPDGLYRTLTDDAGTPLDERAYLYDQAFVLLAFAAAARVNVERRRCTAEAAELRVVINDTFARPDGGYTEQELCGSTFLSNPHMHLLEAALAWCELGGDREWKSLATLIVRLCLDRFVDQGSGMLREFFDDAGLPLAGLPGRVIEPGHQFEWAWLLSRWSEKTRETAVQVAAERLFEIGERYGIDRIRGVVIDVLLADMSPHSRQARLWPQTERLKAALQLACHAADRHQKSEWEGVALAAVEGLSHYLHTAVAGLWHDKMRPDGTFVSEPAPASSLYHIVGAIDHLRRYVNR